MVRPTLFLIVQADSRVDVTYFEPTASGKRLQRVGQRYGILPWAAVLAAFSPNPNVRVIVRADQEVR